MAGTYGGAALLLAASTVTGQAALLIAGHKRWSLLSPAVGLAVLVLLTAIAIRLPGRATTSAVLFALVVVGACAAVLGAMPPRGGRVRARWLGPVAIALIATLFASLPFLANHRVGLLGVSLDNDTAVHLLWGEGLRNGLMGSLYPPNAGYPLGPHSLFATLASLTGLRLDHALLALMICLVPITALAAAQALAGAALWRRALLGVAVANVYLLAAYYGEGAFKEEMMALFLIAFVLVAREIRRTSAGSAGVGRVVRAAVPLALLAGAAIQTYSYLSLAWIGGFLVLWLVVEVLASPSLVLSGVRRAQWLPGVAAALLCGLVVTAIVISPSIGRVVNYLGQVGSSSGGGTGIPTTELGNLAAPLSVYEGLGLWISADFRFAPSEPFHYGELTALALVALAIGALLALRRRELSLLSAAGACAAIYWYSHHHQSPYVSAKALVIGSPVVVLLTLYGLLNSEQGRDWPQLRAAGGIALALMGLYASSIVLRGSPVWSSQQTAELSRLRATIGGATALFLGGDDYAGWELSGVRLAYPQISGFPSPVTVARSSVPYVYGQPFDFDSIDAKQLDRFTYVITTNTPFASQPPANFSLARSLPLYQLWRREGPTGERASIDPGGAPGAVLNCATPAGRRLRAARGIAAVMPAPVAVAPALTLGPNSAATVGLPLPAGTWDVSLDYTSDERLKLSAGASHWEMPANLGRPGPYFLVGSLRSDGVHPTALSIYEDHPSRLTSPVGVASISSIAATRRPDTRTLVPLAQACGRYVDWYRLG
jgi:hypothetical protein